MKKALVIFGSKTDERVYSKIAKELKKQKISFDLRISSAHKTPDEVEEILQSDYAVVIAGAGLAAHLPGVVASKVIRPVIGVPCGGNYQGLDALLSIAQMPPGVPVLAVGVGKSDVASQNCAKMMRKYGSITIIGDKNNDAVKKAVETLKIFEIVPVFDNKPNPSSVNIEFTYFDEPPEKKEELTVYCPLLLEKDDNADAALNFLKHTSHGLWVGINNGINAAVAAVEIMNIGNEYEELLLEYRREMAKKVLEANAKPKRKTHVKLAKSKRHDRTKKK
ncbi:AIR carboxylase family protein [Candidatus Woesearchaeota archaeon]|nr:AIR carboxylase family protein [Candidatus Woesearchaeota archaeon]